MTLLFTDPFDHDKGQTSINTQTARENCVKTVELLQNGSRHYAISTDPPDLVDSDALNLLNDFPEGFERPGIAPVDDFEAMRATRRVNIYMYIYMTTWSRSRGDFRTRAARPATMQAKDEHVLRTKEKSTRDNLPLRAAIS